MTGPARRPDHQGWALRRLLDLHEGLRSDLARLRRAVAAVAEDGQDVDAAAAALGGLSFRQPGWTLRRFCAGFCESVHGHHATEDTVLFPMLLRRQIRTDGALGGVVDRLRAEHRTLTGLLDGIEQALGPAG
jgi:Hemerythrin HHE cation binding domain